MGFWLVAGSLAGVRPDQIHTLVVSSMLTLGGATVLGVLWGFRMPIYEGPASAYLAAIAVVTARGQHGLPAITGGLLIAGAFVALLAVLRVDRAMRSLFSPLIANLFVLVVTLAVVPATLERAIGATHGLPGSSAAWASSLVVVLVTIGVRRVPRLAPYSLLAALVAGAMVHALLAGAPGVSLGGGIEAPSLFPWGRPAMSFGIAIPFVIAGALAAFNTIATGEVVARSGAVAVPRDDTKASYRAFLAHAAEQAGGAVLGNVLGTVSRLDSLGIVLLLGNPRRRPVAVAGALIVCLAFVSPVVALAAAIPLNVSAALLGVILWFVLSGAVRAVLSYPARVVALVAGPTLIPTAIWIAIGNSLSPAAQLVANPMLWGVVLAVTLERLVTPASAGGDDRVTSDSRESRLEA
jgi:xanthine/uracil permease